jgi:uncharacterized protein YjlB
MTRGSVQIDFEGGAQVTLTEWQSMVIPAGTVHRTRAIGRTVNVTYEKQGAQTVFVEPPSNDSIKTQKWVITTDLLDQHRTMLKRTNEVLQLVE